jgi:hypothetical protein
VSAEQLHFYAMQFIDQTLAAVIQELRQLPGQKGDVGAAGGLAEELASGRWAPTKPNGIEAPPTTDYVPAPAPPADTMPVAALSTERSTRHHTERSSTATSSRPTCSWTAAATSGSPTSAWRGWAATPA